MLTSTPRWIVALGAFEAIGGALTILGTGLLLLVSPRALLPWQTVAAVSFGVFAIVAGIQTSRARRRGLQMSIAIQALQIVALSIPIGVRYVALAGPNLSVLVASNAIHANFGGGGAFILAPMAVDGTLRSPGMEFEMGLRPADVDLAVSSLTVRINFCALYFLLRLIPIVRRSGAHTPDTSVAASRSV